MKQLQVFRLFLLLLWSVPAVTWCQGFASADVPITGTAPEALATFREGLRYYDLGDGKKAKPYFAKAVRQDSTFVLGYLYLANTAATPSEWANALRRAKPYLTSASDWEKLVYAIEESYLTEDAQKRFVLVGDLVARYPGLARAYLLLGQAHGTAGDYAGARAGYRQAIETAPDWPGGHIAMAYSYLFAEPKDPAGAAVHARTVVELAPAHPNPYILLGDCLRAQDSLEEAAAAYTKAIGIDSASAVAYYKRGHVHFFREHFYEARRDYLQAGRVDETPFSAIYYVASTFVYGNEPMTAQHLLWQEAASARDSGHTPKAINARLSLLEASAAIAFHHNDARTLTAVSRELEPVLQQLARDLGTPEAEAVYQSVGLYLQGQSHVLQGAWGKAAALADSIRKLKEPLNNPRKLEDYHRLLGHVAYRQGDYTGAITHFEQTSKANAYDKYWRAKAYEGAGQAGRAAQLYKEVAAYNFNELGVALVRREVKKKASRE